MYPTCGVNSSYQPKLYFYELRPEEHAAQVARKFSIENIDYAAHSAKAGDILVIDRENSTLSLQ